MCTQELLWCACGHGEFLNIQKCPRAIRTGLCFTIIHGDHRVVLPSSCSYCKAGLQRVKPLACAARPQGEYAVKIESSTAESEELKGVLEGKEMRVKGLDSEREEVGVRKVDSAIGLDVAAVDGAPVGELEDVLKTEFQGFDLDEELGDLWRYCEGFEMEDFNKGLTETGEGGSGVEWQI